MLDSQQKREIEIRRALNYGGIEDTEAIHKRYEDVIRMKNQEILGFKADITTMMGILDKLRNENK